VTVDLADSGTSGDGRLRCRRIRPGWLRPYQGTAQIAAEISFKGVRETWRGGERRNLRATESLRRQGCATKRSFGHCFSHLRTKEVRAFHGQLCAKMTSVFLVTLPLSQPFLVRPLARQPGWRR
jgi:hypothetical protein